MFSFRLVNVVWGKQFCELFLNMSLPSELAPGNLPYLAARTNAEYWLYTTAEDEKVIRESAAFKRLQNLVTVRFADLDKEVGPEFIAKNQSKMAACHAHFINRFAGEDVVFIFGAPDHLLADGAYRGMLKQAEAGKRLVALSTFRLDRDAMLSSLSNEYGMEKLQNEGIMPRDVVRLAMKNLHPITKSLIWGHPTFNCWPSILIWPIEGEGMLMRQWHLHPIMVHSVAGQTSSVNSLDSDYVMHACPNLQDAHIVEDSDDICIVELSETAKEILPAPFNHHPVSFVVSWANGCTNSRHREFVQRRIRIHSGECTERWNTAEQNSDQLIDSILSLLSSPLDSADAEDHQLSAILLADECESTEGLDELLLEIRKQSFRPIDVVIVSETLTPSPDPRNVPVVATVAQALATTAGEYIYFARPKKELHSDFFRRSMTLLAQYPHAGVCLSAFFQPECDDSTDEDSEDTVETQAAAALKHNKKRAVQKKRLDADGKIKWQHRSYHHALMQSFMRPTDIVDNFNFKSSPWLDSFLDTSIFNRQAIREFNFPKTLGPTTWLLGFLIATLRQGACVIPEPLAHIHEFTLLSVGKNQGEADEQQMEELSRALSYVENQNKLNDIRSQLRLCARFLANPIDTAQLVAKDEQFHGYVANSFLDSISLGQLVFARHFDPIPMLMKLREISTRVDSARDVVEDLVADGEKLFNEGKIEKAHELYKRLTEDYPNLAEAHFGLAKSSIELGYLEQSVSSLENVIRMSTRDPNIIVKVGLLYYRLALKDRAKDLFHQALALNSGHVDAHNNLAVLYLETGQFDRAYIHLGMALHGEPDSSFLLVNFGAVALQLNKRDEARAAFEKARALEPDREDIARFCEIAATAN